MTASHHAGLYAEIGRLLRPFWPLCLFTSLMGLLAGGATTWLLALINHALDSHQTLDGRFIAGFVGLCALSLVGGALAGIGNSVVGQRAVALLRKDIAARVVCAPLAALERTPVHRLMTTLNQDVDTVSVFTFNVSGYASALAISVGCVIYLLTLSPLLFVLAALAIAGGMLIGRHAQHGWQRYYAGVGSAQEQLQKQYRAITQGGKELKLSRPRRRRVYQQQLSGAADDIARLKIAAMRLYWLGNVGSSTLFFLCIGALLVLGTRLELEQGVLIAFVLVMLFVRGPIEQVASGLPAAVQAQVAFRRIAAVLADFTQYEPDLLSERPTGIFPALQALELRDVSYTHLDSAGQPTFHLGPLDLHLEAGQTLFIVGENGSGKTTLVKLLLGLYPPSSGQLLLNGQAITGEQLDDYRQQCSAVFSDYHLFDDLLAETAPLIERARHYLRLLELAGKVEIVEGAFSTLDLSAGQRKRLALVHAFLEQRPLMLFDEWAADQDPTFRRVFYEELLPDLKRQGKTLIVVSHDDRFFHHADQLIELRNGCVVD
ncbi:MAG: cyclic peptide export ABC transporter [Pseudomonas sp.]